MDDLLASLVAAGIIDQARADTLRRQLDPLALREWAEDALFVATTSALQAQQVRFLGLLRPNSADVSDKLMRNFWQNENERLFSDLSPTLRAVAQESSASFAWRSGLESDGARRMQLQVVDWIDQYYLDTNTNTFGSVYQLNRTGRRHVGDAVSKWKRGELRQLRDGESPLAPLIEELRPAFGPERAERIAPTEVTRIFTEAGRAAEEDNPHVAGFVMLTAADELVCPICGPMHGQQRAKGQQWYDHPTLGRLAGPPFHVKCRCDESPVTAVSGVEFAPREDTFRFRGELPRTRPEGVRQ